MDKIKDFVTMSLRGIHTWRKINSYDNLANVEPNESTIIDADHRWLVLFIVLLVVCWFFRKWLRKFRPEKSRFFRV